MCQTQYLRFVHRKILLNSEHASTGTGLAKCRALLKKLPKNGDRLWND